MAIFEKSQINMKIKWIVIGKTNRQCIKELVEDYLKRIQKLAKMEYIEIPDLKNAKNLPVEERSKKEGELIKKYLKNEDKIILLDENGKEFTSIDWAAHLEKTSLYFNGTVTFIVGGAYGFSNEIQQLAHEKLALSKMTFSHQIIRILFAEQLYRALTIIHGHPYHNE